MTIRNIREGLREFVENSPAVAPQERAYATAVNGVVFDSEDADYTLTANFSNAFGGQWRKQEGDPVIPTSWPDTREAPADALETTEFVKADGNFFFVDYDGGDEEYTIRRTLMRFGLGGSEFQNIKNARLRIDVTAVKADYYRVAILEGPSTFDVNTYDDMVDGIILGASEILTTGVHYIDFNYDGLEYLHSRFLDQSYLAFMDFEHDYRNIVPTVGGSPGVRIDYTGGNLPQLQIAS